MNKKLPVLILKYLRPCFLNGQMIKLNIFLKETKCSVNEIRQTLMSMIDNSLINSIPNLDLLINSIDDIDISTCMTGGGYAHLKSYNEQRFHNRSTIFASVLTVCSILIAIFSYSNKDSIETKLLTIESAQYKASEENEMQKSLLKIAVSRIDSLERSIRNAQAEFRAQNNHPHH